MEINIENFKTSLDGNFEALRGEFTEEDVQKHLNEKKFEGDTFKIRLFMKELRENQKWLKPKEANSSQVDKGSAIDYLRSISSDKKEKGDEGFKFEFQGRHEEIAEMANEVIEQFETIVKKRSVANQERKLFTITGGSGVGKTAFSFECIGKIITLLKDFKPDYENRMELIDFLENSIDIYVKQTNGSKLKYSTTSVLQSNEVESWFAKLIAATFLETGAINNSFTKQNELFNLAETVDQFLSEKPVKCIIFRIDEFNSFLPLDSTIDGRLTPIYIIASALLEFSLLMSNRGIFVIPIVSGTIPRILYNLFPASLFITSFIELQNLKEESIQKFIEKEFAEKATFSENEYSLLAFHSGGIYRIVQFMVECWERDHLCGVQDIIDDSATLVSQKYKLQNSISLEEIHQFFYLMMTAPLYSQSIPLLVRLAVDGIVFLTSDGFYSVPNCFILIWKASYPDDPILNHKALKRMTSTDPIYSQDLERFFPQYYCFKCLVFVKCGHADTTFGEFFYGAHIYDRTLANRDLRLEKKEMRLYDSVEDKFPSNNQVPVFRGSIINLLKTSCAIWFGRNCTKMDSYLGIIPDLRMFIEAKHSSISSTKITQTASNKDSFQNEKTNANLQLNEVFFYGTDAEVDLSSIPNSMKNNSIIVSKNEWKNAMTKMASPMITKMEIIDLDADINNATFRQLKILANNGNEDAAKKVQQKKEERKAKYVTEGPKTKKQINIALQKLGYDPIDTTSSKKLFENRWKQVMEVEAKKKINRELKRLRQPVIHLDQPLNEKLNRLKNRNATFL